MHFVADVQGVGRRNGAEVECQHLLRGFASARLYAQKKSFLYAERDDAERDDARREEFLEQLSHIAPEDRVYVDEAGVDEAGVEDTLSWAYGWSRKGSRCQGERLGHRTSRISMAAAWCCGQVLSPLTFQGYCDSALVESWFEQHLCHCLRAGQVVILDNASFHRARRLRELLETVGCSLLLLPPYSPDLLTRPTLTRSSRYGTSSRDASNTTRHNTLVSGTKSMPRSCSPFPIICYNKIAGFCVVRKDHRLRDLRATI